MNRIASILSFSILYSSFALGAEPAFTSLAFTPDGSVLLACSQNGITSYKWPELSVEKQMELHSPNAHDLEFSPNGKRLAVAGGTPADDGTVEILSHPELESLQVLPYHSDSVMSVLWIDDDTLAAASLDHEFTLWNLGTSQVVRKFKGHSRGITALALIKSKDMLVSTGIDQSLRVWNLLSGDMVHALNIHTLPVHDLAVRPGDHGLPMLASASDDRTVRFWQPTIGRMVRFTRLSATPLRLAWTTDGSRVVAACIDGRARVIDPETVTSEAVEGIDGWAHAIAAHPSDGSFVIAGERGQIVRFRMD